MLLDAPDQIHGKQIRPLLKRWLSQALDARWTAPKRPDGSGWWAQGGSTKAVRDAAYLKNAFVYIAEQRASPLCELDRGEDAPAR